MSLIDWDDPRHLRSRARIKRWIDPDWQPEPDLYCQHCREPHDWCECDRKAPA